MAVIPKSTDTTVRKRNRNAAGCITCKIRRVKCDEGRPSCHRCTSTGRKCDGYSAPKEPTPIAYLVMAQTSSECQYIARTAFQYFHEVCAPALSNYGSQSFWTKLVLQACHYDESIKHLIIAASCLGAQDYPLLRSKSSTGCPLYLSHYGKALKLLSHARSPDPAVVLMACLLLVLCNELQHNTKAALQHMLAGKSILDSYAARDHPQSNAAVAEIAPVFSQLEQHAGVLQCLDMTRSSATPSITTSTVSPESVAQIIDSGARIDCQPPDMFTDIDDAAISLQAVAITCVATSPRDEASPPTVFHTVPTPIASLDSWFDRFTAFESSIIQGPQAFLSPDHQILRMYHTTLHILSGCSPYSEETAFDTYTEMMQQLALICAQLVPLTTTRLIPILFFIATRCRNASLRRRAIEVLRQCGVDGQITARIALKVVQIEERGVEEPISRADIPEANRIKIIDVQSDILGDGYILLFRRSPYGTNTPVQYCSVPAQTSESTDGASRCIQPLSSVRPVLKFDFLMFWNRDVSTF
ncbi:hypothetical protein EDD36DRAFT_133241 [Exophiala viscosa]|uniref:Zn(2)-C6 fungal-type domain-containing protein n=1 Tax=Exophiala viscosa TaxID=2486360 RepID=A0AAN6E1C9_9EURO|nr:hypothetical protein EDD36DRAFT_133241 [Exophiala viscosa]